jgi:hypothetical protein
MAEIFISHACKIASDGEDPRLTHARDIRGRICAHLEAAGHKPLLDVESLKPGDDWRARLHRWLGECHGAVILFDSLSVTSDWVRKEATILAWRRSLNDRLVLVPVFLGDFRAADLDEAGYGALDVARWQGASIEEAELADVPVERVTAAFDQLAPEQDDDNPMRVWLLAVAALLAHAEPVHLDLARKALGVDDDDWRELANGHLTLAHQLLHSGLAGALDALSHLNEGMRREPFEDLIGQLQFTWVDSGAAAHLGGLLAARRRPIALINAPNHETGMDYVRRAHCRLIENGRFIRATDVVGEGGVEELLPRYEEAFIVGAAHRPDRPNPLLDKPHLLGAFLSKPPKYVLLGPGAAQGPLLERLRTKYEGAAFVLLAGSEVTAAQDLPDTVLVEPLLSRDMLDAVDLIRLELDNLTA